MIAAAITRTVNVGLIIKKPGKKYKNTTMITPKQIYPNIPESLPINIPPIFTFSPS